MPSKNPFIAIKSSKLHGKGIFAKKDIPKKTKIIEYLGKKVSKKEGSRIADARLELAKSNPILGAVYVFELNKKYDIDGNVPWNSAKYINHSCSPNCEVEIAKGHIWIIALRNLKKGEELSYDYDYDTVNYHEHPCKCGAKNCFGFIVSEKHRKRLKKSMNKKRSSKKK